VSTIDQDLSIQETTLRAAGCHVIRAEKRSGTTTEGREALRTVLEFLHAGDVLMVTFLDMLGVFAEFETNLRRKPQLEGIAKAKAAGVYKGRPPSIEASRVRELKAQGMRPVDIAKALNIGRASVYRVLGQRARNEAAQ
jgi:DNA invertase Pin-like site-specific DNA recombinase